MKEEMPLPPHRKYGQKRIYVRRGKRKGQPVTITGRLGDGRLRVRFPDGSTEAVYSGCLRSPAFDVERNEVTKIVQLKIGNA